MNEKLPERNDANSVATSGPNCGPNFSKRLTGTSKTTAKYWESRVFIHERPVGGIAIKDECFSVRIKFDGERKRLNLGESQKKAAAVRAAEIYKSLERAGWGETLKEFFPKASAKAESKVQAASGKILLPTVGDYIRTVTAIAASLSKKTLADYVRSFRQVAGEAMGIPKDEKKFDYVNGGTQRYREKCEAILLSDLTPERIEKWRKQFVERAGADRLAQNRAKVSCNSILRMSASLFTKGNVARNRPNLLKLVESRLVLPNPLPFAEVGFYGGLSGHLRYRSKIDPLKLLATAREELAQTRLEEFKVFVLAICCGLRRNEIDKLPWGSVDLDRGIISIETTKDFKAKSDDSNAEVHLEPQLVAIMRGWLARATGEYVIESAGEVRSAAYSDYRAEKIEDSLNAWLRSHGVEGTKPLHTLRKEFGSLVNASHGMHAASLALRHASTQVTQKHYLDNTARFSAGLGAHLMPPEPPENVVDFKPESATTKRRKASKK